MFIHKLLRLGFCALPRTGSHAVRQLLVKRHGFEMDGNHHSGPNPIRSEWMYFTTVRNHWDALASWFFKLQGQSDEARFTVEWVQRWMNQHQNQYVFGNRLWWFVKDVPNIQVMRYETLERDLARTLWPFGIIITDLPRVNEGAWRKGKDYREVIPDDAAAFIFDHFREEIEELGYAFL